MIQKAYETLLCIYLLMQMGKGQSKGEKEWSSEEAEEFSVL